MDGLLCFARLENEGVGDMHVVFAGRGGTVRVIELHSGVVDMYCSITAILAQNNNLSIFGTSHCLHSVFVGEADLAWLIIIDDGDAAASVRAFQFDLGLSVEQLDKEVFIRLPLIVIFDANCDLFGGLTGFESDDAIKWLIILVRDCLIVDGADVNLAPLQRLVVDRQVKELAALANTVMQAFETELLVDGRLIERFGAHVLELHNIIFSDELAPRTASIGNLLPVLDTVEHVWAIHFLLELVRIHTRNVVRLELIFQVSFHPLTPGLALVRIIFQLALLLVHQLALEFQVGEFEGYGLVVRLFGRIIIVCGVGENNQNREESEGQPGLERLNLHVQQANVHPYIGEDG